MQQPTKTLLPWLEQGEAVAVLLGGRMPGPNDQTQPHIDRWRAQKAIVDARGAYAVIHEPLQALPDQLQERATAFRARADVQNGLHGLDWDLGVVDLTNVLSFQKVVNLEQTEERVANTAPDDWGSLFSLCLPDVRAPQDLATLVDPDGKALTLSSMDPNLRVAGSAIQEINVAMAAGQPGQNMKFLGFPVTFGTPFVQIAEYQGRRFVRDGYHRCYGLLQKGISRIPCVFARARTFQETGDTGPTFFSQDIMLSDRPPFLKDFLDDAVSVATQKRATRKVIRVQAQEFNVEV